MLKNHDRIAAVLLTLSLFVLFPSHNRMLRALDGGFFLSVRNLGSAINTSSDETFPSVTPDGLTMYFISNRVGGTGDFDLWRATRLTTSASFGSPANLGDGVNTEFAETTPSVSLDGLSIYFASDRPGGNGALDLYVATRDQVTDTDGAVVPFGNVSNLGSEINSEFNEHGVSISSDELSIYFASDRPGGLGGLDIFVATRDRKVDDDGVAVAFENPVNLGAVVNSSADDAFPSISADGTTLFFSDYLTARPGSVGPSDMWIAARSDPTTEFDFVFNPGPPINTGTVQIENFPNIAPDWPALRSKLYFASESHPGGNTHHGYDLWEALWVPAGSLFDRGDCNGDGEDGDLSDAIFLLIHNFDGRVTPSCLAACDANGDGIVLGSVTDAIYMLQYSFLGGPQPAEPFAVCTLMQSSDDRSLGCDEATSHCE